MDYLHVVEKLIRPYDLTRETERKKAYIKCEEYAKEHIEGRLEFNAFMEAVGEKLDMPPTLRSSLVDELGEVPESAKLHLRFNPGTGPELTGNVEGLRYLADLLVELARHGVEHDHTHLYTDEAPMCGGGYPLTIYHEPDAWFDKLGQERAEAGRQRAIVPRNIQPSEVAALCLPGQVPPDVLLTKGRPYRVLAVASCKEKEVWEKPIRESCERFFFFTVMNDDGKSETFGFDLDDPEVLFFSREDVAALCG
jgi:hypothetical protein